MYNPGMQLIVLTLALVVSLIKRGAVRFRFMPRSMKAKQFLKRVFLGKLTPLPYELTDGTVPEGSLIPLDEEKPVTRYKIIYAVAQKR
jgi:hypothetical protein